ncbi:MAG TPA: response regulator transcription factor [Terracidiphilus sp.]|nr:response regulator transcription factor [Terracidiphilus sp.]
MIEKPETSKDKKETVFIVDDDESIREGLSNFLEAVGIAAKCYSTAEGFSAHWSEAMAGCLLLDARLPGISGVEFQERLSKLGIKIPVIFMTAHGDIPMVRKVMKAGAVEFLTKPFQKDELLHAVEQAFASDRARRKEEAILDSIRARLDSLTTREREVMGMVTAGLLNKQIAGELNLSEITVKLHRRQVMEKMRAGSLAELVKMCERAKEPSWSVHLSE